MHIHSRVAVTGAILSLSLGILVNVGVADAGVVKQTRHEASASTKFAPRVGHATMVSKKTVVLRDLPSGVGHQSVHQPGPLARNGKPTYLAYKGSTVKGQKTAGQSGPAVNGSVRTNATGPLVTPPVVIHRNFAGLNNNNSSCACQPPDVNAAAGGTQTVEAVNLSVAVYNKANPPALLKNTSLATFLGETRPLSDPRITYDTLWKRWVLTAIPIPTATTSTPGLDFAVSKTANATGAWWVYHFSFFGGSFPAGTLLDYPMLGQQQDALVIGTNNFQLQSGGGFSYIGSTAFAVPKARAYNGLSIGFPAFGVAFSTHPANTGNVPMDSDGNAYLLAADDANDRLILYKMNNAAYANLTTLSLVGTPGDVFGAPTRGAHQPGGFPDLDALDGRIVAAPVVATGFLWFAHGINISGFPGIQYGAVALNGSSATVANAFHSGTSDDINASIGVFPASSSSVYIYLNWAYTQAGSGIATTDVFSGVSPGEGVPALIGVDTQLVSGGTTSQTRFGDFSSVSIAPYADHAGCGIGKTAYIAQQYFSGGVWATRLADVGFC
jgi:hypothetical protein